MPPRLSLKSKDSPRPLSAIYIGNQSNGNHSTNNNGHASSSTTVSAPTTLPDLPEPPSPVSSVSSGLPSPPATNSTGSGSTGDPGSIAVRRPGPSMASAHDAHNGTSNTINTSSPNLPSSRSSSRLSWKAEESHDVDVLPDHDEDQTMRLKIATGSSSESVLQRARSLAQRNRLQLDKMTSSRLGRASPSSSSSSRNHRDSMPDPPQVLSGSETERENDSVVYNSTSTTSSGGSKSGNRVRLSSAPGSPHRARTQVNNSGTSSPTARRRKRVSLASISVSSFDGNSDDENENYDERVERDRVRYEVGAARDRIRDRDRQDTLRDDYDRSSTRAPTINLNSLKKNTLGAVRRRSALPREFREGSIDEHITGAPPQTPYRSTTTSPPTTTTNASISSTSTMISSTLGRRSTLRGASEDLRHSPAYSITRDLPSSRAYTTPINTTSLSTPPSATMSATTPITPASAASSSSAKSSAESYDNSPTLHARSNTLGRHAAAASAHQRERRQTLRGGSAESALGTPGGRSLIGEGLRAAGLSRRAGAGTTSTSAFRERERERERQRTLSATEARERERELDRVSLVSGSSGNRSRRSREDTPASERGSESGGADVFREGGEGRRVDWSPDSTTESLPRRPHRRPAFDSDGLASRSGGSGSRTLPPRASTSMADYSYTSRSRHQHMRVQTPHLDSEDEDDRNNYERERERDGGRELRAYKSTYAVLPSREASLTRREQNLMERERELLKKEREIEREMERERASSVLGRHQGSTPTPYSSSTIGRSNQPGHQQASLGQSEHARIMIDSLTMFESQFSKFSTAIGAGGTNHVEMLTRSAQTLVVNAERLNTMLKSGNSRALDAQIEAEVEGDYTLGPGPGSGGKGSLVDVWRKIGGEYREGLRVSDELVRSVTGLLLGVGRVMKQVNQQYGVGSEAGSTFGGTPRGSPVVHGRSISLGEEEVRARGGGGGISPDFTGSRESRRSWEPSASGSGGGGERGSAGAPSSSASASTGKGSREEALRRLAGVRPDSPLARASPAFQAVRELDRLETASPGLGTSHLGLPKVNIPGTRRLFAPSQQREMALVAENNQQSVGSDADYEPSPTPRTRMLDRGSLTQQQLHHSPVQQIHEVTSERHRTIALPSEGRVFETPLRRNVTISGGGGSGGTGPAAEGTNRGDRHERRKISIASIATIRAAANNPGAQASSGSTTSSSGVSIPGFSTLTTPSGATTAVTLDGGLASAMAISRTPSGTSGSSLYSTTKPTFSRPEGITGLQQQLEGYRKRLESESAAAGVGEGVGAGAGMDARISGGREVNGRGGKGNSISLITPESERETRRKTYGVGLGARISLEGARGDVGEFSERDRGERRPVVDLTLNALDRNAAATIGANLAGRKERRRTVTDIWPRS